MVYFVADALTSFLKNAIPNTIPVNNGFYGYSISGFTPPVPGVVIWVESVETAVPVELGSIYNEYEVTAVVRARGFRQREYIENQVLNALIDQNSFLYSGVSFYVDGTPNLVVDPKLDATDKTLFQSVIFFSVKKEHTN